jgi:uncharacterized protein (DUF362 family)/Pyruvate/2-oxoacid:ferredoxin oxidoreductase delta subunit
MFSDRSPVISISRCTDYKKDTVLIAVKKVLENLGGMKKFVKRGDSVALKANLLMGSAPEKCICTHPEIVRAVAELVREAGGNPFIVDSPGAAIPHKASSLKRIYEKCGMSKLGIPLNEDVSYIPITNKKARIAKRLEILYPIQEADVIINLPKVKTHCFMILTCAVKNMFGAIPGLLKIGYHSKLHSPERFGKMLLDILDAVKPTLNIIDGITGMEGEGPSSGNPAHLGLIIAGTDAIAADRIICDLIGFPWEKIPYLKIAGDEGLCPENIKDIRIISDKPIDSLIKKFTPPATMETGGTGTGPIRLIHGILHPILNTIFTLKPKVNDDLCVGCGICAQICPEKTIEMKRVNEKSQAARIIKKNCIRCYCCHEMCPHKAISLDKSLLYRIFMG